MIQTEIVARFANDRDLEIQIEAPETQNIDTKGSSSIKKLIKIKK